MQYIVVDTETTGLSPDTDRLVELAGVARVQDELLCWDSLCKPGIPIPPEAMAAHHITEQMVAGAQSPEDALSTMMRYMGGESMVWVAHNAAFDRGFLARLAPSLEPASRWVCTYRCALHLWPDAPGHSNQVLRYWLGLSPDVPDGLYPHRALYDAIVTEAILRLMLQRWKLEDLVKMSQQPAVLTKVRFGKYRGYRWADVPRDYLLWCKKQQDMDDDVRHTASHYLSGGVRLV